jgi:signal transduction histidine kinase/ligand-binding sensor domain-containing protein
VVKELRLFIIGLENLQRGRRQSLMAAVFLILIGWVPLYPQFRSTQWTADSGLPQNIIRGIAQTPDGYLWIATLNGVARFDGVRFTVFNRSNTPGIVTNRFAVMVTGKPGDLWFYGDGGFITRLHRGLFSTLGTKEGVPEDRVYGITSDGNGRVWIVRDKIILEWNETHDRFEPIDSNGIEYRPLHWYGTGFWGHRGQKLYCFHYGRLSVYDVPPRIRLDNVSEAAMGSYGDLWLNDREGRFASFYKDKWKVHAKPLDLYALDGAGRHWRISVNSQLDKTIYIPGMETGIRYNSFLEDDEHNIWVGSEGMGLYRFQPQTIHVYSVADGLAGANVYPVLRDSHGTMWAGTWPAGLTKFQDGKVRTYTPKDGLPGLVSSLSDDGLGHLWIGTHGGLAVLSQGKIERLEGPVQSLPVVQAILKTRDGTLLLGTQYGIDRYAIKEQNHHSVRLEHQQEIHNGDVRVIIEGRGRDIWFGGYNGLSRLHNGSLTHWTEKDGLPSNTVRAIYEDPQGVIWVGTYDAGLGRYADGRWTRYDQRNGLFDDGVFQILEDNHSNLWMSSNRGIFRVSKHQLDDVAAGRQSSVVTVSYGRNDGMLNDECNGGLWPAGAKDAEGRLWFPTQEGVAVVDPESHLVSGKSPNVVLESIELDHAPIDTQKPIVIRPGQGDLELQYTALGFARPDQVVFRYQMVGLDKNWKELGYRRITYFPHLPTGKYIFKVMAASSDGIWSKEQSSVPITVLPPFYLTSWFIATVSGLVVLAVYGFWSYRLRQLRAIQAAQQVFSQQLIASQESERRRIAAELHDGIGQHLIIIKNHALLFLRGELTGQDSEQRHEAVAEIRDEVSRALEETRGISYNLRPSQLDRLGLSTSIEALVDSASRATHINFLTKIDNIDNYFPEDMCIHFYRIAQETLNNIIKHSEARQAKIHVERTGQSVVLSIHDDGKGFVPGQVTPTSGKGGFGLSGIRERATLLGGKVTIQSRLDHGTTVRIEFTR